MRFFRPYDLSCIGVKLLSGVAAALGIAMAISGASFADEGESIIAERPGFSSSPNTLRKSSMQLEAGYQFTDGSQGFDEHLLPLVLFRYGMADNLELQLSWAGVSAINSGGQSNSGATDAGIGLKWQITDDGAATPMALFAGLSLPVGESEFSANESEPTLGLFWTHSDRLDWFGTVLVKESADELTIGNAIGIGFAIDGSKSAYIEYFGDYGGQSGPQHFLNGGVTLLSQTNLQFDLHTGIGLNDRTPDLFIGAGVAYRF